VADFSYAFTHDRDETGGSYVNGGNPKAATYVGSDLSKWKTTALTSLFQTFKEAAAMNSDLSGWNVAKVTTLENTFLGASKFAGMGLDSWDTSSVTTLAWTFTSAGEMNSDLSGWNVAKVTTLIRTFATSGASKFTGTGLPTWNIAKVTNMDHTFMGGALAITSCSKRQIADAWKSNSAFATWDTAWAADACPPLTDASFKQASWGT